jgi:hypothetical protein
MSCSWCTAVDGHKGWCPELVDADITAIYLAAKKRWDEIEHLRSIGCAGLAREAESRPGVLYHWRGRDYIVPLGFQLPSAQGST